MLKIKRSQDIDKSLKQVFLTKNILTSLIVIFITSISWPVLTYFFSFIHELCHYITAIIFGYKVHAFVVFFPSGGYVLISDPRSIIPYAVNKFRIYLLAGSIGPFFLALLINRLVYRKENLRSIVFFPLFFGTSYVMVSTLLYWVLGPFRYGTDPYIFLLITEEINPFVLSSIFLTLMVFLSLYLLYNLIIRILYHIKKFKEKLNQF